MDANISDCAAEVIGMSTNIGGYIRSAKFGRVMVSLVVLVLSSATMAAAGDTGVATEEMKERTSVSLHLVRGGRDNPTEIRESTESYDALTISGVRNKTNTRASAEKPGIGGQVSQNTSFDFWFYEADVILFNDDDNDGYFFGIDLLFDVDTIFESADIYAVLYLSFEGGPWNEYAVTDDFTIFGTSSNDEFVLVTELTSGYLTGSYDILIEIYDAFDGVFLTEFGPADSSALSFLPLEDANRDAPLNIVAFTPQGGGGAIDGFLLSALMLLLLISAIRKIWRRRNDVLIRIDTPAPCWQASRLNQQAQDPDLYRVPRA